MTNDDLLRDTEDFQAPQKCASVPAPCIPAHIGRYRVERLLGEGAFGRVYLAYDDQLYRRVAIKTPHARLLAEATDVAMYLNEARAVASLTHPSIVPVHDVGGTVASPCYVVSTYIDGVDLATRIDRSRLSVDDVVGITATVADALHCAHQRGLVHRDIKPSNILLDRNDNAFVTDFGLALRVDNIGAGPSLAGTPAYMSPEQARGEAHLVDGRSDVFSLGIVLYELLTGRRPFCGDSRADLLDQIARMEAKPPRQINDEIPSELERICLRALAKIPAERFSTAKEMADALVAFRAARLLSDRGLAAHRRSDEMLLTHDARPMPYQRPSRNHLWRRFLGGMAWAALVSIEVRNLAGLSPIASYVVTVAGTVFTSALAVVWMAAWTKNNDNSLRRFGLRPLFLCMAFAAMWLAFFHFIVERAETSNHAIGERHSMTALGLRCALTALFTLPAAFYIAEPIFCFTVWLVRQPQMLKAAQFCVCRLRRSRRGKIAQKTAVGWKISLRRVMASVTLLCISAAAAAAELESGHVNRLAFMVYVLAFWGGVLNLFVKAVPLLGILLLTAILCLLFTLAY